MNPGSQLSRDEAAKAIAAGVPGVVVGQTSAYQVHGSPTTAPQVAATIVPQQLKSAQVLTATEERNISDKYGQAVGYVDALNIPKGTSVQAWLNSNAAKYGNNPNYQALTSMLGQYKAENPTVNIDGLDAAALKAGLKAQQMLHLNNVKNAGKNVGATTFNQTAEGSQPAPAPGKAPVQITSKAQKDALPSGAIYTGPDGVTRTKP
jgi:hypothetical protein